MLRLLRPLPGLEQPLPLIPITSEEVLSGSDCSWFIGGYSTSISLAAHSSSLPSGTEGVMRCHLGRETASLILSQALHLDYMTV